MDEELRTMLKALRLPGLLADWDELLAEAQRGRFSHERLLKHVLQAEFRGKGERSRLLRRQRARIPELLEMETFPFDRQPKLDRKRIMSLYDRFDYMTKRQNLIWLGPTGCGKTGLATGFLLQAIDRGYRGHFIVFAELLAELYASVADHSEAKVLRKYAAYDCLLRGTGPRIWRGMAGGTRKNLGYFWIGARGSGSIVLCESAIDAISCFQLHPQHICISTSGVRANPPWLRALLAAGYQIHCGFDADAPGDATAARMIALHGAIKRLRPSDHDWNDVLRSR